MADPLERKGTERAPSTPTPEWWDKTRPEPPLDTAYLAFEIEVARLLAEKQGRSFETVAMWEMAALSSELKANPALKGKSDEEILQALETRAVGIAKTASREYHPEGTFEFGCFSFEYLERDNSIHIHFHDRELDTGSPLADDKVDRRKQELHDLFALAKRLYPDVETVQGGSWLYSVPNYRRLFPESYVDTPGQLPASAILSTGHGIYGQFLNHDLTLRKEVADRFLSELRALETPTNDSILALFPRAYHTVEGPIADFYKLYGVA